MLAGVFGLGRIGCRLSHGSKASLLAVEAPSGPLGASALQIEIWASNRMLEAERGTTVQSPQIKNFLQ